MKPIDRAVLRWRKWKYGNDDVPVRMAWDDFNVFREPDNSLTYKTMLFKKLEDIADELDTENTELTEWIERVKALHDLWFQVGNPPNPREQLEAVLAFLPKRFKEDVKE